MSISRKFQRSKSKYTLSQKIISAVTAAGFIMQPIVGFAQSINKINNNGSIEVKGNVTHIWADKVVSNAAVNVFKDFQLDANNIANMYFNTKGASGADAANLVNFVNSRIDINGTVNAVKDNKIGGNLFFLSKDGMAVGKSGVINTGSLYVMTPVERIYDITSPEHNYSYEALKGTFDSGSEANINTALNRMQALNIPLNASGTISVLGKVNATGDVKMAAAKIGIGKNVSGEIKDEVTGEVMMAANAENADAYIKTVVKNANGETFNFADLVNIKDANGNVVTNAGLGSDLTAVESGNGDIVLAAKAEYANALDQTFNEIGNALGLTGVDVPKTIEASIESYGTITARGNAELTAEATNGNKDLAEEVLKQTTDLGTKIPDYVPVPAADAGNYAQTVAKVEVQGDITAGQDIKVAANADNTYVDNGQGIEDNVSNILQYITPVNANVMILGSKAEVNIGENADLTAEGVIDVTANSVLDGTAGAAVNGRKLVTVSTVSQAGSFLPSAAVGYADVENSAKVNIQGNLTAKGANKINENGETEKAVNIAAYAEESVANTANLNISSTTTKPNSSLIAAAVAVTESSNTADVIIGSGSSVNAANGDVDITADTVNLLNTNAASVAPDNTVGAAAVNVFSHDGHANIAIDGDITGRNVAIDATNLIDENTITANNELGMGKIQAQLVNAIDPDGLKNAVKNNQIVKDITTNIKNALGSSSSGDGGKTDITQVLSDKFEAGAAVVVTNENNSANVTFGKTAYVTAKSGDITADADVRVVDYSFTASGTSNSYKKSAADGSTTTVTVGAGVVYAGMDNEASVVFADGDGSGEGKHAELTAAGNINVTSSNIMEYNRPQRIIREIQRSIENIEYAIAAFDKLDEYQQQGMEEYRNGLKNLKQSLESYIKNYSNDFTEAVKNPDAITAEGTMNKIYEMAAAAAVLYNNVVTLQTKYNTVQGSNEFSAASAIISNSLAVVTNALAFADPNNYANVAAQASAKGGSESSKFAASGSVAVSDFSGTSGVKIGKYTKLEAGKDLNLESANEIEDVTITGKTMFWTNNADAKGGVGIGGSFNYQNFDTDSSVVVAEGTELTAGDIAIASDSNVFHVGAMLGAGNSDGSALSGMVSLTDSDSYNNVIVDTDAKLTANKDSAGNTGIISIDANNDTSVTNAIVTFSASGANTGVGMGVAINNIDVQNTAQIIDNDGNEDENDGLEGKISASELNVNAETTGLINSVSVAGGMTSSGTDSEEGFLDKVKAPYNKMTEISDSALGGINNISKKLQNVISTMNLNASGGSTVTGAEEAGTPGFSFAGAGSVSLNMVSDTTKAVVDGAKITLNNDGALQVGARDSAFTGAWSGAAGLSFRKEQQSQKSTSVAVSGAVGVNDIDNEITALVKDSNVIGAKDVDVAAVSGGTTVAAGLGATLTKDGAQGKNYSGGGSVSVNLLDKNVNANMEKVTLTGAANSKANVIDVAAYESDVQVTGGVNANIALGGGSLVGGGVTVADIKNNINAGITGGTYTNVDDVNVKGLLAVTQVTAALSAGIAAGGSGTNNAFGGAVVYNGLSNDITAGIDGADITAGRLVNVMAKDTESSSDDAKPYQNLLGDYSEHNNFAAERGIDTTGSSYYTDLDTAGETVNYDGNNGIKGSTIVGAAAVVTAGSNSNAGGAAVNIADIDNDFTAKINNANITAENVRAEADADTLIVNASGGVAAGTKSFGGMGSVTWQDIDNDLSAEIENSTITTNTAEAKAINNTQAVNVAGSVSYGAKAGIGATLAYNGLDNTVGAYMRGNTINALGTDVDVIVDADNTGKIYGIGAGVSASAKVAINGSVAVNRGGSNTEAIIDKSKDDKNEEKESKITDAGSVKVTADDETYRLAVVGSVSASGKAAIGGGVAYNDIGGSSAGSESRSQNTTAAIKNTDITIAADGEKTVNVAAKDTSKLNTISAGVAAAATAGVQGSAATSLINKNVSAEIENTNIENTNIDYNGGSKNANVTVDAQNNSEITTSADTASVAGQGAGVGAGVAVNRIIQQTNAAVNGGTMDVNNLTVNANGTPSIENIGIGIAVAGQGASAAGSVSVNMIDNDVTAHIGDGANIVADDNVGVIATSDEQISNYSGMLSGAVQGAGVGISVSVNQINGNTSATVGDEDKETYVTALGNGADLTTNTDIADSEINNALISDETVAIKSKIDRTTEERSGLVVDASSTRDMKSFLVTAGVAGNAGIAGTVNVNMIKGATNAGVANTTINSGSASMADAGNVFINAGDYTNMSGFVGSLGVGIEGAGVGLASDTNTVERDVTAIVSGSNVNATNKFEIDAESMQGISSYSLGGGIAGMGAGVAGVVTVAELENTTKAALQNSKVNANTVIVNANHKGIVNAGNTGVGVGVVGAGIGLSVGVLKDNSETYAEVSGDNKAEDTITAAGNVKIAATNTAVAKPAIYSTGAGGFAGVAGATSINNLNSKVVTNIKDVAISSTGESISGTAQNNFEVDASMGSFAGAAVGAGAGVTVNTIGSTVQTNVSNSDLEAAKDVILTAEEIRNIKQLSTNAAIGGVAAGVNIAITNVGQKVENTVDGDETVSNAADKIDEANNFYVDKNGKNYGSDLTSGANDALETAGIGSITLDVDAGDGSTKDEAGKIVPIISQISVNITNSDIDAGGTVKANAAETDNIDMRLGGASAGIAAGNVGVGILNVNRNVGVNITGESADKTTINADTINIGTDINGEAKLNVYQGTAGVVGANVVVAEVNTTGSSNIKLDDAKLAAKNVNVLAQDRAKTTLEALGLSVSGLAGFGALAANADNNSNVTVTVTDSEFNANEDEGEITIETNKANEVTAIADNVAGGMVGAAGMGATVSDNGSSVINLTGNTMQANNNIDVTAKTDSVLTAEILNGAVGTFAAGAVSAAMVDAGSDNNRMVTAVNIGSGNTFAAQNINFNADSDITQNIDMLAFSVSGTYSASGNGTDLAAYTEASVTADANNTYKGASDDENGNVDFEASNSVTQTADTSGISAAGAFATGTNIGNTTSNLKTKVDIKGSSADSNINNLTANANSYADIDNNVNGDGGAIADVSPYAAKVNNNYTADTDVTVGGNWNTTGSFTAQAVNGMDIDLKSDAVRAAVVGGSGTWLANTINNAANVVVNSANITTGGAQSYIAQNNVDYAGEIAGSGYGGLNVNATDYSDDLDFTAGVNITGSTLHGTGDDASITAFASTQGDITAKNSLKSAGVIPVALAFSDYDIDYNNSVNVSGSSLTTDKADADITLAATDDTVVKLETIADTQGGAVGAASAKADNAFDRANRINVDSTSTLLSSNDANLYAGANISGITSSLNLQVLADAYNKTALPLVTVPSVENRMTQANQVAIGGNIESVRHVNLKAGKGDTTVTESAKEYNIYQGTTGSGSVASTTLGDTVGGETTNNFVDVTGNVTAGVHNSLNITINGTINIDKNNQNISYSDFNANAAEDWFNDDTIQKTDTTIENNLMERYNEITGLMQQYQESTNEYKSFKQEKENLLKEMLNMGMAYEDEKGNITPVNEISVPAVEVPDIVVSGGNINIDADVAKGNGNLTANSAGSVNITNNSDAYLIINDITMKDAGGQIKFNGSDIANVTSDAGNNLSKDNITTGESSGEVPSINIIGTAGIKDNIQADIGIFGDLTNTAGDITVKNNSYGITVLGNVNGRNISLIAENGNVTQTSTEGFINIGNDPVTKYQFSEKVAKAIQEYIYDQYVSSDGNYPIPAFADYNAYLTWIKENIVGDAYGISESDLTYKVDESKGIVAGGNVYINGLNVNIAGLIQSGYGDYSTTLDETAKTAVEKLDSEWQSSKESLSDNEVIGNEKYCINGGGAVYNTDTDVWDYEVKVYYNPSTGELLTDSINIGGGKIYITGNISSTGGGRIMAMDGAADINIDTSAVDRNVKINSIANNDVSGLVSITDKQKGTVTEYTNGQTRTYQIGTAAGAWQNGNSSYKYSPKDGLQYQWTGGVSGEVIKKYQYKENFLFWGLLDYDTTETFIKGLEGKVESIDDLITSTSGGEGKTDSKDSGVIVTTGGTGADFSITGSYTNTGEEKYTDIVADMKYDGIAGKIFGYGETTYTWSGTQGTASSTTTSIAADKDISIGFIGSGNKEGNINVTGNKDMLLAGNISNAEVDGKGKGSVTLTSETGSVSAIGSANINSDVVNIKAATGVDVNHAAIGNTANINVATDSGNISFVSGAGDLKIEQMITGITYKDDGTIDTDNIDASTGSVYLEAQGDILDAAKGDYAVKGQRIDLVSHTGSIGTKDKALTVLGGSELYSSDAMASSVNAQANGDIVLTQTDDNMRLGTIVSENGDAVLTVNNGSFVDAHPSENNDNSSAQDKIDRWLEAGLINSGDEANESSKAAAQAKQERMEGLEAKAAVLAEKSEGKHTVKDYTDAAADLAAALSGDPKKSEAAKNLQDAKNTYINAYKDTSASHSKAIADAEANGATANEIAAINEDYKNRYNSITEAYLDAQAAVYGDGFNTEEQQLISSYAEVNVDESNYGWSKNQLLYAIQESVLTSEPGTVQTVDTPNVTANNITLNAAEGGIGIDGEAKVIDYADLNVEANLKLLAQAKAGDLTWDELNQQVTIRQQQAITVQVKQEGGKVDVTGKDNVYLAGVQGTELNVNGITTTGDIRLQGDDGVYVDGTLTGVDLTITGGTGDIMGAGSDNYVDTNISGTLDANANGSIYISQNGDLKVLAVATNALADLKATNNILMSDVEGSQAQGYINAQTLNLAAGGNIGTDAINTNALRILDNGVVVNADATGDNADAAGNIVLEGVSGTGSAGELVLGAIEGANLDVTSAGNVSIGKDASEGETAVKGSIGVNGDASISAEDGSVTQTADSNITANAVNASATENILLGSKKNSVNSFVVNGLGADNSLNGSVNIVSTAHNVENTVKVDFGKVVGEETVGLTVNGTVDVTSTGTSGLNISGGSLTTSGNNAGNVTFTSAGSITAGTSVNSAADIVMDAKGAVTNTGSLTARNNIDVTTTTGKIDLGGSVTANTGNVNVETDSGTITTTGNVTGGNDVNVTSGSGAINLGGNVDAETGLVNVTTGSGSITTTGNVSGHKDVTLESVNGDITVGGYTESEVENVTANVKGAGNIEFTGEVSASGDVQAKVTGEGDISTGSSASVSGTDITFTTNYGSITTGSNLTADANVNLNTNTGDIILGGDTTADNGNITININKEGSLKDAANTDNTLSAFSPDNDASKGNIYINLKGIGDVDLSEIYADNDARVDVADGNLTLGTINGQLVAIQLRTQDREMNVGEIIAGTQIVLSGSNMDLDQITQREDADGMLVITPDGAEEDKPIDNFTIGDIRTNDDTGIRFERLWVNNSDIHMSQGQLWFDKLYVEDTAHFSNDNMTAAVYGVPPLRDGSDSVYWNNTAENRPEDNLDLWQSGNGDWMYLRFTDDNIQESNGILLTLDEYDYVYDQRFTAENHLRWQHGRYLDEDWKQAYGYGLSLHNRYGLIDYQEFTETNAGADEVAVEA